MICGISGQDGSLLAKLLVEKGYEVVGTSRDAEMSSFANLHRLGIFDRAQLRSMTLNDFRSVLQVLSEVRPDEIYNLAISLGGTCEGPAGERWPGFYAGYFRDPDGNKLNAFIMG